MTVGDELVEASVAELGRRLVAGETTSVALVEGYLRRIAEVDQTGPALRSVLEVDPDALEAADRLDAERAAGRARGPLHGVPVLVKDNIATAGRTQTTAGSLALVGHPPGVDAAVVAQLRAAGAVVLAKTNLSEWANFRGHRSTSGWSGRGGLTRNPYVLDRTASGSSSGTGAGVAASLGAVGLGTETDGSILSPAAASGLVGVKPTVGLTSRAGVIPISASQDTVGPMCRTVADCAVVLAAIGGVAAPALRPDALDGVRLGLPRRGFWGYDEPTDAVAEQALRVLRELGAVVVEVELASADELASSTAELTVMLHEFKVGLEAYLSALPQREGVPRTLADVIAFNEAHADEELPHFGQELLLAAQLTEGLDAPAYREAARTARRLGREDGVDRLLREHDLQAVVAPTQGPAGRVRLQGGERWSSGLTTTVLAVAGYPGVTVPMGDVEGLPVGLCFGGTAGSDTALLSYAGAFEQATRARRPPSYLPTGGPPEPPGDAADARRRSLRR